MEAIDEFEPSLYPGSRILVVDGEYVIDPELCTGCELCIERCFFEALTMSSEDRLAKVHDEKCMGCGVCQVVCPTDAILMQEARPEAFVPA